MSNVPDKFEQHRLDDAFKFYEHLMKDRSISTDIEAIKPDCNFVFLFSFWGGYYRYFF